MKHSVYKHKVHKSHISWKNKIRYFMQADYKQPTKYFLK